MPFFANLVNSNVKLLKSYELAKLKLSRNRRYPIYSEFTTVILQLKLIYCNIQDFRRIANPRHI